MLLWIATKAFEPRIVLAHLFRPHSHHGFRHGVGTAQGGEIGDGFVGRRCIQISLAGDPRVAAFLALGRFLQYDDLRSSIVSGDRGGDARGPESDDDDIGFDVPCVWHQRLVLRDVLRLTEPVGPRYRWSAISDLNAGATQIHVETLPAVG